LTVYRVAIELKYLKKPWTVSMSAEADPSFTFSRDGWVRWEDLTASEIRAVLMDNSGRREKLVGSTAIDPWLMRKQFFEIDTPKRALAFLREYGLWRFSRFNDDDSSISFPTGWALGNEGEPLSLRYKDLMYQRNYFETALSEGPAEWVTQTTKSGRYRRDGEGENDAELRASSEVAYLFGGTSTGPPVTLGILPEMSYPGPFLGRITCHEIQDALRATVILDWMEGREWPRCKECKSLFKRVSKRPQIYCSSRCSGRARQERFRTGGSQER